MKELLSDEHRMLSLVYKNIREYSFFLDTDLRIRYCNDFTREQVKLHLNIVPKMGMSILDITLPERRGLLKNIYEEVLQGHTRETLVQFPSAVGPDLCLHNTFYPALDETGRVVGIIAQAKDVTAKVKKEAEAAATLKTLDLLMNNMDESFMVVNRDLEVVLFNKTSASYARDIAGIDLKHGSSIHELLPDQAMRNEMEQLYAQVFGGSTHSLEMAYPVNGSTVYLGNRYKPAFENDGSITAIIITTINVTEKVTTEQALRQTQDRWQFAMEGSSIGFWDWDLGKNEVSYSKSYRRMYGFSLAETTESPQSWESRVHPEDIAAVKTELEKFLANKTEFVYQNTYRLRDNGGNYRWIMSRAMITRDKDGKPLRMLGTHAEITDQKIAEEEFRLLFYKNPLPMWTIDRESMRFIDVNDAAIDHYGYNKTEFLGMKLADINAGEDQPNLESLFLGHQGSSSPIVPATHRKKDGSVIFVNITGHVFEKQGRKTALILSQDITEKLASEKLLLQSELNYRLLFEDNPLPCLIFDIETFNIIKANACAYRFYGYDEKSFEAMPVKKLWPENKWKQQLAELRKGLYGTFNTRKWQHSRSDGSIINVEINSEMITYEGRPSRLVIVKDITDQVQAEDALKKSNERFQLAAKAASEALWEWDAETNQLYYSPVYKEMLGFDPGHHTAKDWAVYIHPDEREEVAQSFFKAIEDPYCQRWEKEYRFCRADGSYLQVADHCIMIRNEEGKVMKAVGAMQDISRRKEAEEQARKTNERYLLATKATSDAIYDWDLQTMQLHWTEGLYTLFGYESEELDIAAWEKLLHPDERCAIVRSLKTTLQKPAERHWKAEYRMHNKKGNYRHVLERGIIVRDDNGTALRMIGAIQDITDLKEKEKALLEMNDRFKYATRATSDAIYDWNLDNNDLEWGEGLFMLFGYQGKDVTISRWESLIHPDDRKLTTESRQLAMDHPKKRYWKFEYRFLRYDGSYRYILDKGFIVRDNAGKALRLIGAMQDITQHKEKEQELLRSNQRFDIVIKATNDLIWDWDLTTGTFYRDNEGIRKVYGINEEQSISNIGFWMERVHPEDRNNLQLTINAILNAKDENSFEAEYRFLRDDGNYVYIHDRGLLMRHTDGRPLRMIGAAQDVTERKMLEQQLVNRELNKQKLISQATIETQERERAEIGKELHDNVNQVLTTTKLYLELSMTNADLKDELIQKSSKNVIYVINEIRQLSRSLMNPSLGDLGILDALNDLIENMNLTRKLHVRLKAHPGMDNLLNEQQKLMVFRIAQEGLNNAIRHAGASQLQLFLDIKGNETIFKLKDDGVGFDPSGIKKGAGLKNIQNRVYLANGTLEVESAPGKGCTLTITFPTKTN